MNAFVNPIALLILVICSNLQVGAQIDVFSPDPDYFDPILFNGRIYKMPGPLLEETHPFLTGEKFTEGWVKLKGIRFNNLMLNYDIYSQALLFQYRDPDGALRVIEISTAWLEAFGIGDKVFQVSSDGMMQVLGQKPVTVFYSWSKSAQLTRLHGRTGYLFSKADRLSACRIDSIDYNYKNNKDFTQIFRNEFQIEIRNYLKDNKINLKKASDQQIISLLNHIQFQIQP